MNAIEAIRSVQYDLLEYIQEKVIVDFDNNRKLPVEYHDNIYCIPCFQQINTKCIKHNLQ